MRNGDSKFSRRQLAVRRLLLDGRGQLSPDARVAVGAFKRACHAAGNQGLTVLMPNGAVDPVGTVARAARREIWDHFVKLLNLDDYTVENLRDEE